MARAPSNPSSWSLFDGDIGACLVEIDGDILLSINEGSIKSLTLEITYLMEMLPSVDENSMSPSSWRLAEKSRIYCEEPRTCSLGEFRGLREIFGPLEGRCSWRGALSEFRTTSASEILAGALKDNKRAVLFGEPTYGKGKIQLVFELSDGSGLAVTVARYETPAHTNIDKTILYQRLFQRMIKASVAASRALYLLAISTKSSCFQDDTNFMLKCDSALSLGVWRSRPEKCLVRLFFSASGDEFLNNLYQILPQLVVIMNVKGMIDGGIHHFAGAQLTRGHRIAVNRSRGGARILGVLLDCDGVVEMAEGWGRWDDVDGCA
ncbi:peptidase S41 family protein [Actinidia rufa]|uniref:Peptidase S41 family protein n=1 Tax=Actinidia rufa TaxID=165716 RepID=A0A7J0E174_9ERIC|nr:peptidase S41 family protein [Actinidia rufa]